MVFDATFPLKVFLNLTRHDERRREVENELLDAGIEDYERIAAFSAKWVGSWRGYPSAKRYAQALTHRRAVWTGWRRKVAAVVVFADDVVLAPGFKDWFGEIDLPDDWGIFHFGCQHRERPTPVGAGVVRCALTADLQAYAVRASAFRDVSRALTPVGKRPAGVAGSPLRSCDDQLGQMCARLRVYAAWPNLAWRRASGSKERAEEAEEAYSAEGRQLSFPEAVAGLDEEMSERFGGKRSGRVISIAGAPARERFLFCGASEDVSLSERLRGLASLRLLAKLNGQTACLWWPEGKLKLPGLPEDLLEPTGYRCVSDEREWRRLSHGVAKVERASCRLTPEAAIDLARQRGLSAGYTGAELLGFWRTLARDVRPSRVVHARVTAAVETWQARRPLGVHVGRAEGSTGEADEALEALDERARRRVRARVQDGRFDAIFLACDDPAAERGWREWLAGQGIRALGSNRVWRAGRVGQISIEDRAVDLFLLSRCDAIVGTEWSDFSWMGSVIGGVAYEAVD